MKTKPCTEGARHKWTWVKNVNIGSVTFTAAGSHGRFTLKGFYKCACGATKHGQPDLNGQDLRALPQTPAGN